MFRSRSWFGGGLWKPRNLHSLEHLKYLYNVLSKNHTVSDHNRGLLVETLRSIAEILIWGDQNDSSVFDFFLEKNMLSFFLKIMKQKCGSYVCVQLLQTLNILFENIRNETSLYYLLSNNHVNSIIVHKFDFSDEEVMAYYISFLKTLSLKLNPHTIHFFYNEVNKHTNDFPLYTEAIKFFNHSEGMVRIAVRTLTLNVYRVDDASMLAFIRARTAAPYFSNLVWFIGNHIIELDTCLRNDADHQSQNRLADLVAEHLDHLHYLNDILCLNIEDLNKVLSEHLLEKLLVPLYVYSLTKPLNSPDRSPQNERKHVSVVLSLFLLSQVFLIISHEPLVRKLAAVIIDPCPIMVQDGARKVLEEYDHTTAHSFAAFAPPTESLEKSLESLSGIAEAQSLTVNESPGTVSTDSTIKNCVLSDSVLVSLDSFATYVDGSEKKFEDLSITDEEKEQRLALEYPLLTKQSESNRSNESEVTRPFLDTLLNSLNCNENDYATLFSLCLLYALVINQGVNHGTLSFLLTPAAKGMSNHCYHNILMEKLMNIIAMSCQSSAKIRLVTLEMAIKLIMKIVKIDGQNLSCDSYLGLIGSAREHSTALLRNFYKSEDIFLDMFEDEYNEVQKVPLNVEFLMMDSNILLPPTGTPMTGIEFRKRLPCGEVERARRAIRVFFLIRELSLILNNDTETQLPLTNSSDCVQVNTVLDLNNSDLIACKVVWKDGHSIRRFLVIDMVQFILVEPDAKKLGWGVAKFVGFLQDIDVVGDKDDSRCLHLTIQKPTSHSSSNKIPLLCAKFIFDDHIRCMAAKQRLTKGRVKARQKKMCQIARLLDIPTNLPCPVQTNYARLGLRHERIAGRGHKLRDQPRPMFMVNKVPGFATQMRKDSQIRTNQRPGDPNPIGRQSLETNSRLRDNSPKKPRPRSEEIQLEDMRLRTSSLTPNCSTGLPLASIDSQDILPSNSLSASGAPVSTIITQSEETSFTSPRVKPIEPRRKGQIETV